VGTAAAVPAGATALGSAAPASALPLEVVLKPRDPAALDRFATSVSTPGNPLYRHFLPKGQLARAFGPTAATITAVRAALVAAGLSPGPLSADGLSLPITTTVGRAETGLHTRISSYRLATGRQALADTAAPSLPSSIAAAVQSVIGLDTTAPLQSSAQRLTADPGHHAQAAVGAGSLDSAVTPCFTARSTATSYSAYTADELATAYSFDPLYDDGDVGAGATVALYELEPYQASDISAYQSCFGSRATVTNIVIDHGPGTTYETGEAALDIEDVIGLAPQSHVEVYEAPNTPVGALDGYRRIATDDTAQVVSTSWGLCEAFSTSTEAESTVFAEMVAQGQTVFASSGDSGSENCLANGYDQMSAGKRPVALVADPGTGTVYVANNGGASVSVESEKRFGPVATAAVGTNPDGIAFDPTADTVSVTDGTSAGSVSVLAGATCNAGNHSNCAATTISGVGADPEGIAVDPSDGTLYVADAGSGAVSVISEGADAVVAAVPLGAGTDPEAVAVDDSTHAVYVTDSGSNAVSVIDGTTCNAVTQTGCPTGPTTIAVGSHPAGVVADPATGTVYVANDGAGSVSVIDESTGAVTTTIEDDVPQNPVGIALSPAGGQVLVTGVSPAGTPAVAVIAMATDTVTTFLGAADTPQAVAVDPSTGDVFTADVGPGPSSPGTVTVDPAFLDVEDPASQSDVTGVGGTNLTGLTGPVESAWGDPLDPTLNKPYGAGGGGISSVFALPAYQSGIVDGDSSGTPCAASTGDCREVPDVSASSSFSHGEVVYESTDTGSSSTSGWTAFGGTSGAAPLWAALAALVVVRNDSADPQRLGNLNPDLYLLAAEGHPDFNDITTGDNDYSTTNGGSYGAGPGYDMATGLGSPIGSALAVDLNPSFTGPSVTVEPVSQSVGVGQIVTLTAQASGDPAPSVQWQMATPAYSGYSGFANIAGATADTLRFRATASQNGDAYQAVFTNPVTSTTSDTVILTVQPFSIVTTSLPAGTRGDPYSVQLEAVGNDGPVLWGLRGRLPKGLTISPAGLLSGTPPVAGVKAGPHTFVITALTKKSSGTPKMTTSERVTLTLS
jgi:YVTN family beta-propeller protein